MDDTTKRRSEILAKVAEPGHPPRAYLDADLLKRYGRSMASELSARAALWGAKRSSFSGRSPEIRAEIEMAEGRPEPSAEDRWIPLPPEIGGRLRVFLSKGPKDPGRLPPSFSGWDYSAVADPIAPGAPIFVPSGSGWSVGGVAAVLTLSGQPHLLTCAHIFNGPSDVFIGQEREPIATVTRAYLDDPAPLDAAVCEITAAGLELLERPLSAETWYTSVHAPEPEDNGAVAVFYPTSVGNEGPYEIDISSYWASTSVLFRGGPQGGLIEIPRGVIGGDSGSVLALNGEYYGLCSGNVEGQWSFFTPIAAAIERLRSEYDEVALWTL